MNTVSTKPMRDWAADLELGRQSRPMTFGEQLSKLRAKGGESPIYKRDRDYYRPITGPFKRCRLRAWLARRAEDALILGIASVAMLAVTLTVRVLA